MILMMARSAGRQLGGLAAQQSQSLLLAVVLGEQENSTTVSSSTGHCTNCNAYSLGADRGRARHGLVERTRVGKAGLARVIGTCWVGRVRVASTAGTCTSVGRLGRTVRPGVGWDQRNAGVNQTHERSDAVARVLINLGTGGSDKTLKNGHLRRWNIGQRN